MKLKDLQTNSAVEGILASEVVTVVNARWFGSEAQRIRLAHLFDPFDVMSAGPQLDQEDLEDLGDAPENEVEGTEEQILGQATAAGSIEELRAEIRTLENLEGQALKVRQRDADTKWQELGNLLTEIFTPAGTANRVGEPDVGVTSVNYSFAELLAKADKPS